MAGQIKREVIQRIAERNTVALETAEEIYRSKPPHERSRLCYELHRKIQKSNANKVARGNLATRA